MKLCHGTSNLISRGRSARKDKDERLFTCQVCGQKWQWTESSGYYQVKIKSTLGTKSVTIHLRVTPTQRDQINKLSPSKRLSALLEAARKATIQ